MTRTAIIDVGRWGRRFLGKLDALSQVVLCCNRRDPEAYEWVRRHHPHIGTTCDAEEIFRYETIRAVNIATPIATHSDLVLPALRAGKHVFHVFEEKPLVDSVEWNGHWPESAAWSGGGYGEN